MASAETSEKAKDKVNKTGTVECCLGQKSIQCNHDCESYRE